MPPPSRLAALAALLSAAVLAQGVTIVYDTAVPFVLNDAAVFPDGRFVTVSTQNVTIRSTTPPWFLFTFAPYLTCGGSCVVAEPNGSAIAVCCTDGVRTYSTTGQLLRFYPTVANPKAVAYHPTADELAVVFDNSLQLFIKSSATEALATPVTGIGFLAVAYSPANPSLVLATTTNAILIVNRTGSPVITVSTSAAQGTALAEYPAGKDHALVYLGNLTWSLLTASTGTVLATGTYGTPGRAAVHPSGEQFTLINDGGTEAVFLNNGTERTALQHAFGAVPVRALYNPADWSMVILTFQQRLVLWVDPGAPQQPPSPAGPQPAPSPSGPTPSGPTPSGPTPSTPPANATGSPPGAPPPSGLSTPVVVAAVVGGTSLAALCGFGAWKMITKGVLCGGSTLLRQQQAAAATARHEALRREVEGVKNHISGEQRDSDEDEDEDPSFDSLEEISTQEPTSSAY